MQIKLSPSYREVSHTSQRLKKSHRELLQTEKLTSLAKLAASIAHEVNNPLAGVLLYTKLLSKKISNDDISKGVALDYLSKMDYELTRTTALIRNLKDFSKQSSPLLRKLNINEIICHVLDSVVHLADQQHIRISKEFCHSPPMIMADSAQLQQVFTNLILNSIEAMPQGGKLIVKSSLKQTYFKIEIQDTGFGIPKKNMTRLFTPFFSTKPEVKGVGLGLAVSYGIVKQHKGSIQVQSESGKGTIFTVLLPIIREEAERSL